MTADTPDFDDMVANFYRMQKPVAYTDLARHCYIAGMEAAAKIVDGCIHADRAAERIRTEAAKVSK